jgi:hypothetical protein
VTRLIGMLSWYKESASGLAACVASLPKAGCFRLVAVDGPYQFWPGANAEPSSGPEQAQAILETAHACGIGVTLHRSNAPWAGGEVEKRAFMFAAALQVAEPGDWLLWIDADEVIHRAPRDLRKRLAESERDVATVSLWQRQDPHVLDDYTSLNHRVLYRALPGLTITGEHDHVTDGALHLRGQDQYLLEEPEDCHDLVIEHRKAFRSQARVDQALEYQTLRGLFEVQPAGV